MKNTRFLAAAVAALLCVVCCVVCPPLWGFCDALFLRVVYCVCARLVAGLLLRSFSLCDLLRCAPLCEGETIRRERPRKRKTKKRAGFPFLRSPPRAPPSLLSFPALFFSGFRFNMFLIFALWFFVSYCGRGVKAAEGVTSLCFINRMEKKRRAA